MQRNRDAASPGTWMDREFAQIGLVALAQLCRRLSIAMEAGLDLRRIWAREAQRAGGQAREVFSAVRDHLDRGGSLHDALLRSGGFFPPLVIEMAAVGEDTGNLPRMFRRLAEYYEYRVKMRRLFLSGIAWPLIQLSMAVVLVGVLIWVMGVLAQHHEGKAIDLLGLGLVGPAGLAVYLGVMGTVAAGLGGLIWATRRGMLWTRWIQRAALRLPVVGACLETMALARLTWTLHLTLNVEMSMDRLLPLALRAAGNDHYQRHTDQVVADVANGYEIHEALRRTRAFPPEFLDAVEVGEHGGRLVESMEHLSQEYEDQARGALRTLTVLAGFLVWLLVAVVLVSLIFRLAMFYIGAIQDASRL